MSLFLATTHANYIYPSSKPKGNIYLVVLVEFCTLHQSKRDHSTEFVRRRTSASLSETPTPLTRGSVGGYIYATLGSMSEADYFEM